MLSHVHGANISIHRPLSTGILKPRLNPLLAEGLRELAALAGEDELDGVFTCEPGLFELRMDRQISDLTLQSDQKRLREFVQYPCTFDVWDCSNTASLIVSEPI